SHLGPPRQTHSAGLGRVSTCTAYTRQANSRRLRLCLGSTPRIVSALRRNPPDGPPDKNVHTQVEDRIGQGKREGSPIRTVGPDESFLDPLPDEQRLHHRLGELGVINTQSHPVRTLK